jgi:hypothetical protein
MNNKKKNQCHLIEMAHLGFSADSIAFVEKLCAWITENPADMKQLESFILGLCEETRDNNSDPEATIARIAEALEVTLLKYWSSMDQISLFLGFENQTFTEH